LYAKRNGGGIVSAGVDCFNEIFPRNGAQKEKRKEGQQFEIIQK
jgi:hypothetical protein